MPVEIRELQIITVVTEGGAKPQQSTGKQMDASATEKIIAECVEQVLDILKQKNER